MMVRRIVWVASVLITMFSAACSMRAPTTAPAQRADASTVADASRPLPNPKEDTRALWTPVRGEFLRDWLLCGTFAYDPKDVGKPAMARDYLSEAGGEAAIRPVEGAEVRRPDGSRAKWARINSGGRTMVVRSFFDPPSDYRVAYAYAAVEWPVAGPAVLSVGSDDDARVWLNGQLVHEAIADRRSREDQDLVSVRMQAGVNHLLVKTANRVEKWGLAVRVLDLAALARKPLAIEVAAEGEALSVATDHPWYATADFAPVQVAVLDPRGRPIAQGSAKRGQKLSLPSTSWPQGPYELRCTTPDLPTPAYVPFFHCDAAAAARQLVAAAPGLDASTRKGMVGRMLADLVRDRLKNNLDQPSPEGLKAIGNALLEWAEVHAGGEVRPGGFHRMAWRDPIDDSAQFCRVYLPAGYDKSRKWPTVVFLHGYNPANPPYINWWSVDMRHHYGVDRYGFVLLEVHGRGNTGYSGLGEQDVLRALEEARKTLSLDPERTYLTGESMGGAGTWHVGSRNPHLFAAIAPVYGGWDYRINTKPDVFARLTPEQRFARERWSSYQQAESLLTTPVFINHGDADELVHVDQSRFGVRLLQRWGYDVRYWEHPGKGHTNMGQYDTLYPWLLEHRLVYPTKVRIRSAELKSSAAHWLRLTQTANAREYMVAEAEITGPNTVRLETRNVLEAELSPRHALIDPARPLRIAWNAAGPVEVSMDGGRAVVRAAGYVPPRLVKTAKVEGPVGDISNTPFAIVQGTAAKDPLMKAMCRYRAQRQVRSWEAWQKVTPRFFTDAQITDEQIRQYSLILIGGPEENLVARKLIDKLPLKIAPDAITIAGQPHAARDAGVAMIHPHPLAADRYVLVIAANSPQGMYHTARLPDDADFAVSEGRIAASDEGEPDALVAVGDFDYAWQYAQRLTRQGLARHTLPVRKVPSLASAAGASGGQVLLSDVLEDRAEGSFEGMGRDRNWKGRPIVLAGKTYASGLGVQCWRANHSADWALAGAWRTFRATVGLEIDPKLEPDKREAIRVQFAVKGDGKELFRSPPITWASAPLDIQADVTGARTLTLEVIHQGRPSMSIESVNWATARLER